MPTLWELTITRHAEQQRTTKRRTPGTYVVTLNGAAVPGLSGASAESRGPGANRPGGNGRCVEPGSYDLHIQAGEKYRTTGYTTNLNPAALKRPGLLLLPTDQRTGILIHPARGFLWSIGCINLATALPDAASDIDFIDSRARVIALIDHLRATLGNRFPTAPGAQIPDARVTIR